MIQAIFAAAGPAACRCSRRPSGPRFAAVRARRRVLLPASPVAFSLSFLLLLVVAGAALACPACKEALANDPNGPRLTQGWARSIYLLMWTPYILFGGVTFAIVRSARRAKQSKN